jgi:NAD(P)-dependent dehydrogenase (short-subunit alcohol dehydrogenase family)
VSAEREAKGEADDSDVRRTVAITGSSSGIGSATKHALIASAHRVIGVDLRGAEITADLSKGSGRAIAAKQIGTAADHRLDGLVLCAGIGPSQGSSPLIVSINYFGAVELLERLFDSLRAGSGAAAVAVSSNSATTVGGLPEDLIIAMLDGDEGNARWVAESVHPTLAYAASKAALARAIRRLAPGWAEAGVRLNAVAPGAVRTPLLEHGLDDEELGPLISAVPIPSGGFGTPGEIASVIEFLLSERASFLVGSVVFADGGTDALLCPDRL